MRKLESKLVSQQFTLDLRAVPDDLEFPYKAKEVCTEKPSKTSNFNFLNRALTHTTVSCTWDEPEENNVKNEMLFKDDIDDKLDLDDFIAPGIDEGYDPDEDDEEVGIDSGASSSGEESKKPVKKQVQGSSGNSTKANSIPEATKIKLNAFSDFDKSKRGSKSLRITFQNALESKLTDDDNRLGKREYRMTHTRHTPQRNDDRSDFRGVSSARLEDNAEDFFEGTEVCDHDDIYDNEEEAYPTNKEEKIKLKFKERMKEKKKSAKLEKEQKRNELKMLREEKLGTKDKRTQDLELIAGERREKPGFRADYEDPRFNRFFEDPDMAIDTTSNMYKKDKHAPLLIEKKKRRDEKSAFN